jgi:type IX secretion system PorP/SprF family membrane protein
MNRREDMKIFKRTSLVAIMVFLALLSKGQQDPMYSQYIFNLQTINPAYAGSWKTIGFMSLTRIQWVGLDGHPTTQTLSFQAPLKRQNVGIGFNIIHDKVGLIRTLSVNLDYSYRIFLSDVTSLRLGIKGGFTNFSNNLPEYEQYPDGIPDPAFQTAIENKFMPNIGVGVYLDSPFYFLSLSLPKIIENNYQSNLNNFFTKSELRHFFLTGGVVFRLSEFLKLKPTFMSQIVQGAPFLYDLSANFLLGNKVWLGGMYRSGDAVSAMAQWIINDNLRIGYAHDFTTTDLRNFHSGVHEIMLSFEFSTFKRVYISPRYF